MLTTLLIAFAVFALAVLLMAVGVIASGKRIQGSCGGLASMQDENGNSVCTACSRRSDRCPDRSRNAERSEEDAAA